MKKERLRIGLTGTAVAAAVALAAGCGGGGGGSAKASSDPQAQALRFAKCLRAHGLDVADPDSQGLVRIGGPAQGGSKVRPAAGPPPGFAKAQAACKKYAPSSLPISAEQQTQMQNALLAFSRCMRAHGVSNYPDPKFDNGSFTVGGAGFDPSAPAARKATQICQKLLPKPGAATDSP